MVETLQIDMLLNRILKLAFLKEVLFRLFFSQFTKFDLIHSFDNYVVIKCADKTAAVTCGIRKSLHTTDQGNNHHFIENIVT